MSTDARIDWPAPKERAAELSDKLRLVRDALSLDLGDGVDVVDGARACREERDQLRLDLSRLEAEIARLREDRAALDRIQRENADAVAVWAPRALDAESKLSALIASVREIVSQRHSDEPCEDCGQCVLCRYHSLVSALQQAIGGTQ